MEPSTDLRHSGLKATLPRMKVMEIFTNSPQRHLAAEDVYRLLVSDNTDMGLATVYRVLGQFEQTGLLKKSVLGNHKAVYELNDGQRRHGHLVCTKTGEVKEFFDPVIEARLLGTATRLGFDLADYSVTIYATPKP